MLTAKIYEKCIWIGGIISHVLYYTFFENMFCHAFYRNTEYSSFVYGIINQTWDLLSKREWIEMNSDFQKYWLTNVKMNAFQSWMHFYLCTEIIYRNIIIYRNCVEHIFMPFNLKIILAFSVNCELNIFQFKILNRKLSFSI